MCLKSVACFICKMAFEKMRKCKRLLTRLLWFICVFSKGINKTAHTGLEVKKSKKKNLPENPKVSGESYDLHDHGNMFGISFMIEVIKIAIRRVKRPFYRLKWAFQRERSKFSHESW